MEFSEVEVGRSTTSTLLEVNHTRSEDSLDINGTLRGETIIDTERPDNEETTFDGTWEMIDGEFSALVGGETTARPNLSSGADLILHTQEDRLEIDGETFFGTTMEAWVKRPESLSSEEVIGSWGLSGIITEILPVTGTDSIELRDFEPQEARIEFQADGTGTISNLTSSDIPQRSSDQNFTWTLDAREILVSAGDGEFRFTMTEGKDFAVLLKSTLATDLREFNFFALSKLPNVPGFTADAANGSLNSTSGISPEVALTIESVAGIPYQVEESENLAEWITRTPPVLGTGGETTSTLEAISTRNRFYRWKLLPLEEAP
jgi:hypothetical protein